MHTGFFIRQRACVHVLVTEFPLYFIPSRRKNECHSLPFEECFAWIRELTAGCRLTRVSLFFLLCSIASQTPFPPLSNLFCPLIPPPTLKAIRGLFLDKVFLLRVFNPKTPPIPFVGFLSFFPLSFPPNADEDKGEFSDSFDQGL